MQLREPTIRRHSNHPSNTRLPWEIREARTTTKELSQEEREQTEFQQ